MMYKKIEDLRRELNEMLDSPNYDNEKLLDKSRELDILIVQMMREKQRAEEEKIIEELENLLDKLEITDMSYQRLRIVDPVHKKVLILKDTDLYDEDVKCFEFWNRGEVCDNCISLRAFNENNAVFKLEYQGNKIYMVTAIPIIIKGKSVVMEFIKNTTDLFYISNGMHGQEEKIYALIDRMNNLQ
ncbi:Spo0E like sporulation regulatory protein [Oxobacter pfennigii]|uniref:Spo0E like sporulation regulatory protein n=1 Tax=Oxobacter pfennigii TaxID=36849 RepID=A0A0P8YUE7_9CLOT|nr:aspartyl-phosphate phosphatase Spo0E family protein [Oxobacter pfennigii]KPU43319.1 Spo0E like sporulation regulatory protein [Oxobacter pfennigii]